MKQGIHPDYHKINIVMTDGTKYETRSTWGKEGDTLQLDVDSKTHPAWVGGVHLKKTGQMEKFSNRFKGMSFESKGGAKTPAAAAPAAPAADKKAEKKAEPKADKKAKK